MMAAPVSREPISVDHSGEMERSPAWRALPELAKRILYALEAEYLESGAAFCAGRIKCNYDQLMRLGPREAVLRALRELRALGFVEIRKTGDRAIGAERLPPTFYVLTYLPPNPRHDWRRILTSGAAADALARAAGHGFNRSEDL